MQTSAQPIEVIRRVFASAPGIDLVVLFGSRARGDATAGSDWDIGFVGEGSDEDALRVALTRALGTDEVDLVDLRRANALLRFRVARDGQPILERRAGAFDDFRIEAAAFYCDVEPVLRRAYEGVLEGLGS